MGREPCDDGILPALGAVNDSDSELGEMECHPGAMAILIDALKKKGVRFDEVSVVHGDISHHDHYVVTIRGGAAKVLHRAFESVPRRLPAHLTPQDTSLLVNGVACFPGGIYLDLVHSGVCSLMR